MTVPLSSTGMILQLTIHNWDVLVSSGISKISKTLRLKSSQVSSHHVFPNLFTPPVWFSAASAAPGPGGPASARVLGPAGADPSARSWDVYSTAPNGGAAACDWSSCGASWKIHHGDPIKPGRAYWISMAMVTTALTRPTTADNTHHDGNLNVEMV